MKENDQIFLVVGDLGFKLFDDIRADFPDRFINCNAAEQCMLGIGVGLSLQGKTVFCYSITPFLLFRAAELIRNYIDKELIPVLLVGSGRDNCYHEDGFSHYAGDDVELLNVFHHIKRCWPINELEIEIIVTEMIEAKAPCYLNLKR